MGFAKFFTVRRIFEIEGDIEDLEGKLLLGSKSFDAERQTPYSIVCTPKVSVGIGMVNGFKFYPITTDVQFARDASGKITVEMHSGMRGEIAFLFVIWFVILVISAATAQEKAWITFAIFPLIILWFQFIYRSQQEMLQKTVENHLKRS